MAILLLFFKKAVCNRSVPFFCNKSFKEQQQGKAQKDVLWAVAVEVAAPPGSHGLGGSAGLAVSPAGCPVKECSAGRSRGHPAPAGVGS